MIKKRSFSCGFINKYLASANQNRINSCLNTLSIQCNQLIAMISIHNNNFSEEEQINKMNLNGIKNKNNISIIQAKKKFNSDNNLEKIKYKICLVNNEIFDLKQQLSLSDNDHFETDNGIYLNCLQNKIKEEEKNLKASQDEAQELKLKVESMNKASTEMRMQYLREIQHLREMIYRKEINPDNALINDAHYFSTSEGFDRETQKVLNSRISQIKNEYEKIVLALKNTINDIKGQLLFETEKSERTIIKIKEDTICQEVEVLCKKLQESKKSPILVWNSLIQLFGKDFFKSVIIKDFDEPKVISEIMKTEFQILKNSISEQIKLLENQYFNEIYNLKQKNESLNNQINDILFNSNQGIEISQKFNELRKKIEKMNKIQDENQKYSDEISQLNMTITKIQSDIIDKIQFKENFSKNLFSIVSELLKIKSKIYLNNSINKSLQKLHNKITEKKNPEDSNDFNNYLEANSFIKSVHVQTDRIERPPRRKSNVKNQNALLNIITSSKDNKVSLDSNLSNNLPNTFQVKNEDPNNISMQDSSLEDKSKGKNRNNVDGNLKKSNYLPKNKEYEKEELRKSEIAIYHSKQNKKDNNKFLKLGNGLMENKTPSKKKPMSINQRKYKTKAFIGKSINYNADNLSFEPEITLKRKSLPKENESLNEIIMNNKIELIERLDFNSTHSKRRNNNKFEFNEKKFSSTFNKGKRSNIIINSKSFNQSHSWIKNHQNVILEKITRYAKHYTINNHSKVREIRQKIFSSQSKQKNA